MVDVIVLSPTDAARQEAVVGSAQRVVVARARAPRDAAVQHCLEYLGSEHPYFELERSARSVVQFEGVLPESAPCVAYAPTVLVPPLPTLYYTILNSTYSSSRIRRRLVLQSELKEKYERI